MTNTGGTTRAGGTISTGGATSTGGNLAGMAPMPYDTHPTSAEDAGAPEPLSPTQDAAAPDVLEPISPQDAADPAPAFPDPSGGGGAPMPQ
jgi:hypothetical protein